LSGFIHPPALVVQRQNSPAGKRTSSEFDLFAVYELAYPIELLLVTPVFVRWRSTMSFE